MIVKFTEPNHKHKESLTVGKMYIVITITIRPDEKHPSITVRSDDDGTPCVFSLDFFEVVDPKIPKNWGWYELNSGFKGYYRLQPTDFHGEFWDSYHDGDEESDKLFEKIYSLLRKQAIANDFQV